MITINKVKFILTLVCMVLCMYLFDFAWSANKWKYTALSATGILLCLGIIWFGFIKKAK